MEYPKLSILICSIDGREESLDMIVNKLKMQDGMERIEVIINKDDGTLTVGAKRNLLLEEAAGEYIAFVDDDDDVSDDYIDKILEAIESGPDCVGLSGKIRWNGEWKEFHHSIQYGGWYTGADGNFYRTPNHLNPVRREIALQAMFDEDVSYGEDCLYSRRLRPLLNSEVNIEGCLYIYNYVGDKK